MTNILSNGLSSQISRKWIRHEQLAKEELKLKTFNARKYCVVHKLQVTLFNQVYFVIQQRNVLLSFDMTKLKFISQMVFKYDIFLIHLV